MNILPKKRWHVRTKENIARVRKDEAEAAEKEKEERLRIENADREARLNLLKHKSKQRLIELDIEKHNEEISTPIEHVNLFADLDHATTSTNKEHDKEVKEKKEEYEKKIGYLTYLGQDTNEALGKKNWYEVLPQSSRFIRSDNIKDTYDKLVLKDKDGKPTKNKLDEKDGEIDWKVKQQHDPIKKFLKYCEGKQKTNQNQQMMTKCTAYNNLTSTERTKKDKKSRNKKDNDKDNKLKKLREARLKREREEKYKTEMFLTKLNGGPSTNKEVVSKIMPKYNSQFNPELARQNYRHRSKGLRRRHGSQRCV